MKDELGELVLNTLVDCRVDESKQSIDRLVERLAAVNPVVGADIEEFRGVIDINFRMATGAWRLQDITDKPELWSVGPTLPDTGEIDADRDWDWKHVTIRCIAWVEGSGSLESYVVREVRCQVTPRCARDYGECRRRPAPKSGSDPDSC